ncbi:ATP-binding SpoIIE family protein phosphatase [Actinocorallia longicatena]|uniref:PPM-type phosphatase domain-containing protein n=1 Tax=Actinocorallia longicatena TaxID=111803 RepID=A0ABP6Q2U1_9ACTN
MKAALEYLGEATARIGTRLDPAETARALAGALVPRLADAATVYLSEGLFTGHRDDGHRVEGHRVEGPLRQVVCLPSVTVLTDGLEEAMGSGESVLGKTDLAVPLQVRGRILGAVLLRREQGFDDEIELMLVAQLAAQAALAADNAHRYRVSAAAADTLQRSMLPTRLPRLAGIDLHHRYLPASDHARIGGDWFDAIPLPSSRIALVVGDVMGHGMSSAAIMGQLRTAVQTLAALDLPPGQVLRQLDGLAQGMGEAYLATCLYVVYDPVARRLTFANAGHLPPVLMRADGTTELLAVPEGVPIGVGGVAFEPVEMAVADGDRLVLCTDGLVEVRGSDIMTGMEGLRTELARRRLSLDAQCEELIRALPDRQDDVALLMADLQGIPASHVARWMLQPRRQTPAKVRRLIRSTLRSWGLADHIDTTELLATELVTNSVRYATRPVELRLVRTDALLVEVTDDDFALPVLRSAADDDEGGRGLQLVSRLARRWGATRTTTGKVVWFEQPLV